jgi:hypothetical protein
MFWWRQVAVVVGHLWRQMCWWRQSLDGGGGGSIGVDAGEWSRVQQNEDAKALFAHQRWSVMPSCFSKVCLKELKFPLKIASAAHDFTLQHLHR